MAKARPPYGPEFRGQMVELVRAGRDPADLAREFESSAQAIRNWVAQADGSEGRHEERSEVLTAAEREELTRLRREVRQLRLERDILSQAAARMSRGRPAPDRARCRRGLPVHERETRAVFPIIAIVRANGVSEVGYRTLCRREPSARARAEAAMLKRIRTIHNGSGGI